MCKWRWGVILRNYLWLSFINWWLGRLCIFIGGLLLILFRLLLFVFLCIFGWSFTLLLLSQFLLFLQSSQFFFASLLSIDCISLSLFLFRRKSFSSSLLCRRIFVRLLLLSFLLLLVSFLCALVVVLRPFLFLFFFISSLHLFYLS